MTGQPEDAESREWGHRFVDGTGGPDDSREAALETAAKFKPGFNDWRGTRLVELGEYPNPPKVHADGTESAR